MKAIALISGGLDSSLAAAYIKGLGIEVIGLHCDIPFYPRHKKDVLSARDYVRSISENIGIEIIILRIGGEFLEMVKKPKFGYGSNINPCIDCRILMLRKAKEFMHSKGAQFVITGDVLHQRDMSQRRNVFRDIDQESGLCGLVVRPLSARLLPKTIPEHKRWLDRERMLDFSGRTRRPQIKLAEDLGIRVYPNPAGGCLLTDRGFSRKLRDLMAAEELNMDNAELLKWGRHFRIAPKAKLAVGRDQRENEQMVSLAKDGDYLFMPLDEIAGPTVLGRGRFDEGLINLASKITCYYCDNSDTISSMEIVYMRLPERREHRLFVSPLSTAEIDKLRI